MHEEKEEEIKGANKKTLFKFRQRANWSSVVPMNLHNYSITIMARLCHLSQVRNVVTILDSRLSTKERVKKSVSDGFLVSKYLDIIRPVN